MERVGEDHMAGTGPGRVQQRSGPREQCQEEELGHAAPVGVGALLDHLVLQQFGENRGCEGGVHEDVKVVGKKYTGAQRPGCRLAIMTTRAEEEGHGQEESLQPRAPRGMLQGRTPLQPGACLQPFGR